jgi:hypothetical protein
MHDDDPATPANEPPREPSDPTAAEQPGRPPQAAAGEPADQPAADPGDPSAPQPPVEPAQPADQPPETAAAKPPDRPPMDPNRAPARPTAEAPSESAPVEPADVEPPPVEPADEPAAQPPETQADESVPVAAGGAMDGQREVPGGGLLAGLTGEAEDDPADDEAFLVGVVSGPSATSRSGGGAHRRDGAAQHWPWLAALGVVALLIISAMIALVAAAVRDPQQPRPVAAAPPASTTPPRHPLEPTNTVNLPPPIIPSAAPAATLRASSSIPVPPTPTLPPTPRPTPTPTRTTAPTRPPPLPTMIIVPNVVGERTSTAVAKLRAAGFTPNTIGVPARNRREIGRVITQSPAGGTPAQRGSMVLIIVGTNQPG